MRITPSAEWPHEATRVTLIGAPIYTVLMGSPVDLVPLVVPVTVTRTNHCTHPHTQAHARLTSSANPSVTGQVFAPSSF